MKSEIKTNTYSITATNSQNVGDKTMNLIRCFATLLILLHYSDILAQTIIGQDDASNYTEWTNGSNEGTGFEPWVLLQADPGGHFLGSSTPNVDWTNGINSSGQAFGMWNEGAGATVAQRRVSDGSWGNNHELTFQVSFRFDGGTRGFNIQNSDDETIFFLDITSGGYGWTGGNSAPATSWESQRQNGEVLTVRLTQTGDDLQYQISGIHASSPDVSGSVSGVLDQITLFNNANAGGENQNFYFNNFEISTLVLPDAITLQSPPNESENVILRPQFEWQEDTEATTYELQVATDAAFSATVINEGDLTGTTFTPEEDLSIGEQYFWRVRGISNDGNGAWSEVWSFTTESAEGLGGVVLVNPAANAQETTIVPTFSWEELAGAETYHIQIATGDSFTEENRILSQNDISGTSFSVASPLLFETEYFWRVRGVNNAGNGEWSEVRSFTTTAPIASYAGTGGSGFGGTVSGSTLHVWDNDERYFFQFDRGPSSIGTNDVIVFYLHTGNPGRNVIDAEVNDQADPNRRAISSAGDFGSIITFPNDFEATHAVAIGQTFGGLWKIPATGILENDGLEFITAIGNPASATSTHFSFTFTKANLDDANEFGLVGTYVNGTNGFTSNEGYGRGFALFDENIAGGDFSITSYFAYPSGDEIEDQLPELPGKVTLLQPADVAQNVTVLPVFTWEAESEAATYELRISESSDFDAASLVAAVDGISSTEFALESALWFDTEFFWQVRAVNQAGTGEWSDTARFTTTTATVSFSGDGGAGFGGTVSASTLDVWNDETYYFFQFNRGPGVIGADDVIVLYLHTGEPGRNLINAEVNDQADPNRRAISSAGDFATQLRLPNVFQATHAVAIGQNFGGLWRIPAEGQIENDGLVFLSAVGNPAAEDAPRFTFRFAKADLDGVDEFGFVGTYVNGANGFTSNEGFGKGFPDENVGGSPLRLTSFYVYPDGSEIENIIIAPGTVTLVSPENEAEDVIRPVVFEWEEAADADSYTIEIRQVGGSLPLVADASGILGTTTTIDGLSPLTEYRWRVKGVNEEADGPWSEYRTFVTSGNVPGVPELIFPANAASGVTTAILFQWAATSNATGYQFQLTVESSNTTSRNSPEAFTDVPIVDVPGTTLQQSGLNTNTRYIWRVRAVNDSGPGAWSAVFSFRTMVAAPGVVTTLSPAQGATGVSIPTQFQWEETAGAETYRLQVGTSATFQTSFDSTGIRGTTFTLAGLERETTYYWRMQAINSGGVSGWSDVKSFTTLQSPPGELTIVAPEFNASTTLPVTLIWNKLENADTYEVQIATLPNFVNLVFEQTVSDTTILVTDLDVPWQYHWRVRAVNSGGNGPWATSRFNAAAGTSVTMEEGVPTEFVLHQNYPNPFNPTTNIRFGLPQDSQVSLDVYTLDGRRVARLVEGSLQAGHHEVTFHAGNLASGLYIYRLRTSEQQITRMLMLVK